MQNHIPASLRAAVALFGCASVVIAWAVPSNDEIRELLAERMQHNGVGVVVGVVDGSGRRVVAHGKSGAGDARPLDGDTVFQIGSLTKVFTTLLLAEMIERGEVKLDDAASAYLPSGMRMPERGRPISLRDLATHMSGLPSMPTNYELTTQPDPYEAYSVEQLHQFLSSHSPEREPGERWAYSNLGVSLLGRLLARRSGMEYETLLERRVLEPLGMNSTSISLNEDQLRRLAPGHDRYLHPVRTWEMTTLPASGSLRSSANDMLILLGAYLGYEDSSLKSAMTLQLNEHVPLNSAVQALGWVIRADGTALHSGGKQGYRSGIAFNPATGTGAVVLANARTDDQPLDLALHLVTGEPMPLASAAPAAKVRAEVPYSILDRYTGHYRFDDGEMVEVARSEHHLLAHSPGNGIATFFAIEPTVFFLDTGNDEMAFSVDGDGRVTGLILYGDGMAAGEGRQASRVQR